jgi:hypothetical protein
MSESRRKLVVFAIFVLAVAWGIYNQPWKYFGSSNSHRSEGNFHDTAGTQGVSLAAVAPVGEGPRGSAFVSDWTVDPFRSKKLIKTPGVHVVKTDQGPVPVLQGTMIVGNEPVCVIGGQILKKGDRFGEWRVDAVAADWVEIARFSDQRRLTLHANSGAGNKRR